MITGRDSILFLLGAGASVDAGIMHAKQMTDDIESKINSEPEFQNFRELYNYLKSSLIYQRGLEGAFDNQGVTVEDLLNILFEINQKHLNKLYPFIGGWNVHLLKVAGEEFDKVEKLDKKIRDQLFEWINIPDYDNSKYFSCLGNLARELNTAIRVFTLNYDLCVENAFRQNSFPIELGFNDEKHWDATRFDGNDYIETFVFLYKLHGSIDWIKINNHEKGQVLKKCDTPQAKPEIIFGTTTKLSSIDPYLFYVHEFRKYSLNDALRFIVTIGYSFSDEYMNRLIGQSMMRNRFVRVLAVSPTFESDPSKAEAKKEKEIKRISKLLGVSDSRVIVVDSVAKSFFQEKMNLQFFESLSEQGDDDPF